MSATGPAVDRVPALAFAISVSTMIMHMDAGAREEYVTTIAGSVHFIILAAWVACVRHTIGPRSAFEQRKRDVRCCLQLLIERSRCKINPMALMQAADLLLQPCDIHVNASFHDFDFSMLVQEPSHLRVAIHSLANERREIMVMLEKEQPPAAYRQEVSFLFVQGMEAWMSYRDARGVDRASVTCYQVLAAAIFCFMTPWDSLSPGLARVMLDFSRELPDRARQVRFNDENETLVCSVLPFTGNFMEVLLMVAFAHYYPSTHEFEMGPVVTELVEPFERLVVGAMLENPSLPYYGLQTAVSFYHINTNEERTPAYQPVNIYTAPVDSKPTAVKVGVAHHRRLSQKK